MKKILKKSIIMMMVAFCYQVANAQSVVTNISTDDFSACKAYLAEHPLDTIKNKLSEPEFLVAGTDGMIAGYSVAKGDTLLLYGYSVFMLDGKVSKRKDYRKVVRVKGEPLAVVDFESVDALDRKAVETRFEYDLTDGRRRDVIGYQIGATLNSPDGKVIERACNKDGWSIIAAVTYRHLPHLNMWTGAAGFNYQASWWLAELTAGPTAARFSRNSDRAGEKYTVLTTKLGFFVQPFKLDKYDQWRVSIGGGLCADFFKTDSKETENGLLKSEGNTMTPFVGVKADYFGFGTRNGIGVEFNVLWGKQVLQNIGEETSSAGYSLTLKYSLPVGRNKILNK